MGKFRIVKSRKRGAKKPFLILEDNKIVGRTSQIGLDLRPRKGKKKGLFEAF